MLRIFTSGKRVSWLGAYPICCWIWVISIGPKRYKAKHDCKRIAFVIRLLYITRLVLIVFRRDADKSRFKHRSAKLVIH